MKNRICIFLSVFLFVLSFTVQALAGINLVALSEPLRVNVTIYQPADLCLVREQRELILQPGTTRLGISWHGTLLDPTSLEITPSEKEDRFSVLDWSFPPRTRGEAVCLIQSDTGGKTMVESSYLMSGFRWQPFYTATLAEDARSLRLEGLIRITNRSGKDFNQAGFRVLAGDINIVDGIQNLARRNFPYGRPSMPQQKALQEAPAADSMLMKRSIMSLEKAGAPAAPQVTSEGVSDFFLFTVEGAQSIPDGQSKGLPMLDSAEIKAGYLYKYDQQRYGRLPIRFLTFINEGAGSTGPAPLPPGDIAVYRSIGPGNRLCYEGRSKLPYSPRGKKIELNLGQATGVVVEPTMLEEATAGYSFDRKGNISGWDEAHGWKVDISNTRSVPIRVQIDRHTSTPDWKIDHNAGKKDFEKVDKNTFRFKAELEAGEKKTFRYTLTTRRGSPD